jgi:anti-anti-sigma regulatory factor
VGIMIRISQTQNGNRVTLALAGFLDAQGAEETSRAIDDVRDGKMILDLSQLRHADRDGIVFLASLVQSGIELRGVPVYIRTWLQYEMKSG